MAFLLSILLKIKGLPWMKIIDILGPILLVLVLLYVIYSTGYEHGKAYVQALWDKDKVVQQNEMIRIKTVNDENERQHSAESVRISNDLQDAKDKLASTLKQLDTEHALRMQSSKERGSVYQRLSQGTAADRASLASHAAELDASLEEGRGLVKEFTATLGLREDQLRLLGSQITADRKLMDGVDNGSTAAVPTE